MFLSNPVETKTNYYTLIPAFWIQFQKLQASNLAKVRATKASILTLKSSLNMQWKLQLATAKEYYGVRRYLTNMLVYCQTMEKLLNDYDSETW